MNLLIYPKKQLPLSAPRILKKQKLKINFSIFQLLLTSADRGLGLIQIHY